MTGNEDDSEGKGVEGQDVFSTPKAPRSDDGEVEGGGAVTVSQRSQRRGRLSNAEKRSLDGQRWGQASNLRSWRGEGEQDNGGSSTDSYGKREREGEMEYVELGVSPFTKSRKTLRSPEQRELEQRERERRERETVMAAQQNKIVEALRELRADVNDRLDRLERQGEDSKEEVKGEVRRLRGEVEEWERMWEQDKVRINKRLDAIERGEQERAERKEEEARELEDKMRKLAVEAVREEMKEQGGLRDQNKEVGLENVGAGGFGGEDEEMRSRMARLEAVLEANAEAKERERRKRNIMIKGMEVKSETGGEEVEALLREIGLNGEEVVVKVRKIEVVRGMRRRVNMWVRPKDEDCKRRVMMSKNKLKGRREFIEDDLTFEERNIRRKIEDKGRSERMKGKRVRFGKNRCWVDGVEWRWDRSTGNLREIRQVATVAGEENRGVGGKVE